MSSSPELDIEERATLFDAIRKAADGAGMGLAITDLTDGIPRSSFVNEGLAKLLGYSADELVGREVWSLIAEDELPQLKELSARRAAGEDIPNVYETVILHRSGRRVPIEMSQSRTTLHERPITVSFISDISSRREAMEAMRESEKRFRDV